MKNIIILCLLSFSLNAQIRLISTNHNGLDVVSFIPESPMKYILSSSERIVTSISLDSLNQYQRDVRLYVFMELINYKSDYNLIVTLEDNTIIFLAPSFSNISEGYYEYNLTNDDIYRLRTTRFRKLTFSSKEDDISCVTVNNSNFYVEFLNKYIK
jgi:hypothetical protein